MTGEAGGPIEILLALARSRVAILFTLATVTALVAGAAVRLVPWSMFFVVIISGGISVVAYAYIRQWWAARKDRQLEEGLGAQHQGVIGRSRVKDREALKDLEGKFTQGIDAFRRSKVGRQKRYLYALPWYVIIGPPRCGKTSAIENSGLRFPMAGDKKLKGQGGTRNCDWFFAEEAILLDTAGRYTYDDENAPDREEWLSFLRLLKKYRPAAPINGLMVALSAEDVLSMDEEAIAEQGRGIRNKIDELVREFGIQFPIYMLITKCDLVEGFTDYFGRLPKKRLDEMLGWTNPSWEMTAPDKLVADAMAGLRERIAAMRTGFLWEEERPEVLRNIYIFPEEFRELQDRLGIFCDVVFRETKYNESPFLRGVYFTSGLQKGSAISKMLARLGMQRQASELREERRSYFLKDFFQSRLPDDRNLVATTGSTRGRMQVAHNLGLAGIAAVCVLIAVVTGGSYVRNRRLLLQVEDAMRAAVAADEKAAPERVAALGQYVEALETLEDRNRRRPLSAGWGLYVGYKAVEPARALFLSRFARDAFTPAIDAARRVVRARDLEHGFTGVEALIRNRALSRLLNHTTDQPPGPNHPLVRFWSGSDAPSEDVIDQFGRGYNYYLRWRDGGVAESEHAADLALLKEVLPEMYTVDRVATWADRKYREIRAEQLPVPAPIANGARVRGAFTPEAWSQRVQPLSEAVAAVEAEIDPALTDRFRQDFLRRYFSEWLQFLTTPRDVPESGLTARQLLGDQSPYLAIVDKTAAANRIEVQDRERPAWIQTVTRIAAERAAYLAHLQAVLNAVAAAEQDPEGAVQDAKQIFSRRPSASVNLQDESQAPPDAVGKGEFWVQRTAAFGQVVDGDDQRARERTSALLRAPLYEAFGHLTRTVHRELNRQWDLQVLRRAREDPGNVQAIYCQPSGAVWVFEQEFLRPFLEQPGYVPKVRYTKKVPFSANLGAMLSQADKRCRTGGAAPGGGGGGAGAAGGGGGADGASAPQPGALFFESIPTGDPGTSGHRATRTVLTLYCGSDPWVLEHRQYVAKRQLQQPTTCTRAELTLYVGSEAGDERPLSPIVAEGAEGPRNAAVNLLLRAHRSGNVYSWQVGDYTVSFRVSGIVMAPPPPAPTVSLPSGL